MINVQVGFSSVGCVVCEVPNDVKITKVRVILDSGYGPQTGDWTIGRSEDRISEIRCRLEVGRFAGDVGLFERRDLVVGQVEVERRRGVREVA
ncbi:MAG TPA: hypothetical protein VME70_07055, partial [Mycobacteriales bacterium]|nr:hypothetical protein [Mycobacteriales bacterium]